MRCSSWATRCCALRRRCRRCRSCLEPVCRRGWGSIYAALARGRIDTERLRDLLVGCLPPADPLVFAVDVTTWPRCDAECSPERGYYHPSRHSAGQPIIAGWAFQWIAQVSFELAWRAYIRRFDLEHTVRFCKQTLGWTTPRPRHPEQADRWTWLGAGLLCAAAPGPRGRGGRAAAVGAAPPAAAAVTGAGPPRVSATSGLAGLAGRYPAIKKATNMPRKKATKITKAA